MLIVLPTLVIDPLKLITKFNAELKIIIRFVFLLFNYV